MLCGGGVSDFGLLWSDANLRDACIALGCERAERNCNVASNQSHACGMLACVSAHVQAWAIADYGAIQIQSLPLSARVHPHGVHC